MFNSALWPSSLLPRASCNATREIKASASNNSMHDDDLGAAALETIRCPAVVHEDTPGYICTRFHDTACTTVRITDLCPDGVGSCCVLAG